MEGSSQLSDILAASVYAVVSVAMLVWAWIHLERRHEVARRTERIQQLVVVAHFVLLAGWFLRHRIGLSERGGDPTTVGLAFETAGVVSSYAIAASAILLNPGVRWNRFLAIYVAVALLHGGAFGAVALGWPEALGLVPRLEDVIHDRDHFGSPDPADAIRRLPDASAAATSPTPQTR
jgi:hypothetical protein